METNQTPTPATTNPPPTQVFSARTVKAMKEYRTAKPWRGNLDDRKAKLAAAHTRLCDAFQITCELVFSEDIDPLAPEGTSRFEIKTEQPGGAPPASTITLHNRLSVVTYLVAIGMARGFDYAQAWTWGVELYRKMFPLSAARHQMVGGFLLRIQGQ